MRASGGQIEAVLSLAAARQLVHPADRFILATGGILGGGLYANADGSLVETALRLPIQPLAEARFQPKFLDPRGQPIFRAGLIVNEAMKPVNENNQPLFDNLQAIGGALGGCDPLRERCLEGIALCTGWKAGQP
jgi:glycerol-3-phosphate dehydrogenase subunit B